MDLSPGRSVDEVVEEIMRLHRSLPARPGIEEVEAARTVIANVEREEQAKLEAVASAAAAATQHKGSHVPEELLAVLQEMQKNVVFFQSREQKREPLKLLDLENVHVLFDDLIQRASNCVAARSNAKASVSKRETSAASVSVSPFKKERAKSSEILFSKDDSYMSKTKPALFPDVRPVVSSKPQLLDSSLKPASNSGEEGGDKLSLIKLASLIEVSAKKGTRELMLQNKLMDQVDWLPDSIGKLSSLVKLDLSENRITVLPSTLGCLSSLTSLDLHSNKIVELPECVGDLSCLVYLNVGGNQLSSLPDSLGRLVRLEELDLSSNQLSVLPDTIGSLVSLKILNVETNDIEEIPHSIGRCCSLRELCADYNRLKALPEAVGKIESLEVLSVRYNNVKQLPTTMSSLTNLKELNVSFNELEYVPESLCFATSLVKMNIGNNFADMRSLPRSIGNLEMLEELDISNNQIRVLPDSFRMLTRLRVLKVEENPLEVPPRHVAEKGAQAVVQYMAELVEKKDVKSQPLKQKKGWAQICFFSKSNKRKRDGVDFVKT
ncbi:plant intracellular Ras-group-related LRR protein 4 [Cajanus cajan]|uniref:Malignant fibrous histiocytoma-amplified sequence 1 n=1 Tax=Cajanus cajan TaxID=3821 RepID=A0A151UHS2_CAJCA|nr:plant intracellular Ras-group-related LRR protein 4 [Cajanus cajan]